MGTRARIPEDLGKETGWPVHYIGFFRDLGDAQAIQRGSEEGHEQDHRECAHAAKGLGLEDLFVGVHHHKLSSPWLAGPYDWPPR